MDSVHDDAQPRRLGSPGNPDPLSAFADPSFDVYDEVRMYQDFVERLPFAVYIKDRDARFVDVNPFHSSALGLDYDEIVGCSDADLYPAAEAELYHSADRRVIEDGEAISGLTENHTRFNGTVEQHQTSKFPVRNSEGDIVGLMGFAYGVTESSSAIAELKRSELRYALAARASRDGIWEFDVKDETVLMSPRTCQLLGLPITADPVPWLDVAEALSDEDQVRLKAKLRELLREEPTEIGELQVQIAGESGPRWLDLRFIAFTEHGRVTSLIGSVADVTDSRARLAQLDFYAHQDALTGLGNRRALTRKLADAFFGLQPVTGNRHGTELSLLCVDLDSFKVINDSLGHGAGDTMLKIVSHRLQQLADEFPSTCTVARYGGDEFAVVVEGATAVEVEGFAHSLVRRVKEPAMLLGLEVYPSASVGVVHVKDQLDAADVLRDADTALYRAKETGKSRATIFEPGMRQEAKAALDEQTSIRRAVENGEFVLTYQPVVSGRDLGVEGFEALLRLRGPDGTLVRPALFLDYLEQSDLIIDVGRWVIEQAVNDLADWRSQYGDLGIAIGINVSRRQFADEGLFDYISEVLERHGLPEKVIVLEITETAVAREGLDLEALQGFRSAGGYVAIDDFGTGQSSLFQLNELPVDMVKLDRSFIARIGENGADSTLEATFEFLRSLDARLVAEGVEEQYQAQWLAQRGVDFMQGYHFARPMPDADVRSYLAEFGNDGLRDAA